MPAPKHCLKSAHTHQSDSSTLRQPACTLQTARSTVTASNTLHQHLAAALQRHGTSMPAPNCKHHSDSSAHSANSMRAPKRTKSFDSSTSPTGWDLLSQIHVIMQIDVLKDNLIFPNHTPESYPRIIPQLKPHQRASLFWDRPIFSPSKFFGMGFPKMFFQLLGNIHWWKTPISPRTMATGIDARYRYKYLDLYSYYSFYMFTIVTMVPILPPLVPKVVQHVSSCPEVLGSKVGTSVELALPPLQSSGAEKFVGSFHSHGGTPIARWFIGKIPWKWMIWRYPCFWTPPYIYIYKYLIYNMTI